MMAPGHAELHYRARFNLCAKQDVPLEWGNVVRLVRFWVGNRVERNDAYTGGKWFFIGGEWSPPGGHGVRVQTQRFVGKGQETAPELWAMRFEHPCRDIPHRTWRTDIGLVRLETGDLEVSITNCHWIRPGFIGAEPASPTPAAPGIVLDLIADDRWEARLGATALASEPRPLAVGEGMTLRKTLEDSSRACPLVFIMGDRHTGHPLLNAHRLAKLLAGTAVICLATAKEIDEELEYTIPKDFRCWPGMVRVYLPGLKFDSPRDARRHRFFLARDITVLGAPVVENLIIEGLARRFVPTTGTSISSIDDVADAERRAHLESALRAAREGAQDKSFVEFCDTEVKRLEADSKAFREQRDEAAERAENADNLLRTERYLRQEAERRMRIAEESTRQGQELVRLTAERGIPVSSLSEAIGLIERMFPNRIVFTPEARQSAEKAGFNDEADLMPDAFRLLWHLATTMHDLCFGTQQYVGKLEDAFRQRSGGIEITMTERKLTKQDKEARAMRRIVFEGQELDCTPHLKLGNDPDTCLRVHFAKAKRTNGNEVIVIGHCGDHLKTAGTRKRG